MRKEQAAPEKKKISRPQQKYDRPPNLTTIELEPKYGQMIVKIKELLEALAVGEMMALNVTNYVESRLAKSKRKNKSAYGNIYMHMWKFNSCGPYRNRFITRRYETTAGLLFFIIGRIN